MNPVERHPTTDRPIENRIIAKLGAEFAPAHLEVINESHMHSVAPGSETHFKVVLAAAQFAGKRQVQRHQAIYACLAAELQSGVHALALHTFSPEEWQASGLVPASPQCLGGSKHDHQ
ncbi:MAG: BolA/IbaG family iron-sulfur metabolism protein [Cellvibrio sp.]|uniref:BolA family protein n=1 Tax=Cellvibrio sp. TaxID=1965322 RepID=UPI0031B23363